MNTRTSKSSNKNNSSKSNAKNITTTSSTPSSPKNSKSSSPRIHPKKNDDVNKLQATHRKQRRPSREESPAFKRLDKSSTEQVYAGPTFNNAPVPSTLPIPSFSPRGSPINQPQPLYMSSTPSFQHQSAYLMNLLVPQQKPVYSYELEQSQAISEIQNGLRSMLKIAC